MFSGHMFLKCKYLMGSFCLGNYFYCPEIYWSNCKFLTIPWGPTGKGCRESFHSKLNDWDYSTQFHIADIGHDPGKRQELTNNATSFRMKRFWAQNIRIGS